MRNTFTAILIVVLIAGLTGCEAVQRKFTRKKKSKPVRPMFYKELDDEESRRPPAELYMTHFTYWKTWMSELIANAGKNKKRDIRACNEAMANLEDMAKYLTGEKKEELKTYIEELSGIADQIKGVAVNKARMSRLRQQLDKSKARIARKFYYKKVKEHIRKD